MQTVDVIDNRPDEAQLVPPLGADETYSFNLVGDKARVFDRRPMSSVELARRDLAQLAASGSASDQDVRQLAALALVVARDAPGDQP